MTPETIHEFWFADTLADPAKAEQRMRFWFSSQPEDDREIAARFGPAVKDSAAGKFADWECTPEGCLALIIVLDQFPRNIHRGTPPAFACDAQALGVARRGIGAGYVGALHTLEQAFVLMPFQHCEELACQREGLAWFQQMAQQAPPAWQSVAAGILRYARLHLEIIERFGRFPHRNRILGRASTPVELEYLHSNTESFGQSAEGTSE